jgi:hypothetical protein
VFICVRLILFFLPRREPNTNDNHLWKQCHECGLIVPVYELQKEVLEGKPHGTIRNDVPIAHGFRKFFSTQLVNAEQNVKPN